MTTNTANKRLAAAGLFTKKGEINARFEWILNTIAGGCDKFRPCIWHRSGRRHTMEDNGDKIKTVLDALRLPYIEGNDAARGGREGDYIEITPAARRALAPVRADFAAWKASQKK